MPSGTQFRLRCFNHLDHSKYQASFRYFLTSFEINYSVSVKVNK